MHIRDLLVQAIQTALDELHINSKGTEIYLEYPEDFSHGDFASTIALVLAKKIGQKPKELAENIATEIIKQKLKEVEKITVAGPGFINIYLSRSYFSDSLRMIDEQWGKNKILSGKKMLVEKSAPNLFKPFHVGHFLNLSIGESLTRLFSFSGADVIAVAYPSDISLGASKALWGIIHKGLQDRLTLDVLGECYVYGTKMYDEHEFAKQEIIDINKKLNEKEPGSLWDLYQKGRELNLHYFKDITKRFGSEFSDYFFESDSGIVGKSIIEEQIGTIFEKSDGAVIFKGQEHGLHTRVFITSLGLPVYEAKDIGLIRLKFQKYNPDVSLVITDIEQKQYFEVIRKVAILLFGSWGERSLYWQHGRLRFEGASISSRYGNVPLAEDVIEQVKQVLAKKMNTVEHKAVVKDQDMLIEHLALGALRYSFLRSNSGKNIVFDFQQSLSLDGDSGIYLQYSYARACSILAKASANLQGTPTTPEASILEKLLVRFPDIVERSAIEYEPHYVTTYLTELAAAFHSWYAHERILGSEYESYKCLIVSAFATIMKNGLWLLNIEAPVSM